jgi:hypothetical protein
MGMSNMREKILASEHRTVVAVDVPEWCETVHVRSLSAAELDSMAPRLESATGSGQRMAIMVAAAAANADGSRMFGDDDIAALATQPTAALFRVTMAANRLNNLDLGPDGEPGVGKDLPATD